jgi:hypothetical protein
MAIERAAFWLEGRGVLEQLQVLGHLVGYSRTCVKQVNIMSERSILIDLDYRDPGDCRPLA